MRRVLVLLVLWFAAALPAQAEKRPFRLAGGQVVFDVNIKGITVPALLDTGATRSMIEVGLAKELGIRWQKVGGGRTVGAGGGRIEYGQTRRVPVDVGAGQEWVYLGTFPTGAAFADDDVRVLIGMDLLEDLVLSLDFEAMTVELAPVSTFAAPAGEPLKLKQSGWGRWVLPVSLAGAEAELVLDTAASVALHLDVAFVAKTPVLSTLPSLRQSIMGVDGVAEHAAMIVPHVGFAGETFADVKASAGSLAAMGPADDMDGVMGVALLRHFNLVIDFGRHRVWMTRRETGEEES